MNRERSEEKMFWPSGHDQFVGIVRMRPRDLRYLEHATYRRAEHPGLGMVEEVALFPPDAPPFALRRYPQSSEQGTGLFIDGASDRARTLQAISRYLRLRHLTRADPSAGRHWLSSETQQRRLRRLAHTLVEQVAA